MKGNKWHPELCINQARVIELFKSGLSTRQIAKALGYSPSYTAKICLENGHQRTRSEAAILRQPPTSTTGRALRNQARKKVERILGVKLPSDQVVHHKDGNPQNNALDNLEVLSNSIHGKLHHPAKYTDDAGNPIPKHLRVHVREYMRQHLKTYQPAYRARKKN